MYFIIGILFMIITSIFKMDSNYCITVALLFCAEELIIIARSLRNK